MPARALSFPLAMARLDFPISPPTEARCPCRHRTRPRRTRSAGLTSGEDSRSVTRHSARRFAQRDVLGSRPAATAKSDPSLCKHLSVAPAGARVNRRSRASREARPSALDEEPRCDRCTRARAPCAPPARGSAARGRGRGRAARRRASVSSTTTPTRSPAAAKPGFVSNAASTSSPHELHAAEAPLPRRRRPSRRRASASPRRQLRPCLLQLLRLLAEPALAERPEVRLVRVLAEARGLLARARGARPRAR